MLQNSESVTTRTNPPLSPPERDQRYRQALRELRGPRRRYQIRITEKMVRGLLKRGYLGPDERDDLNAIRQALALFISDTLRKKSKPKRKTKEKERTGLAPTDLLRSVSSRESSPL